MRRLEGVLGRLGASWAHLGASWDGVVSSSGGLGGVLGASWAILEAPWGRLGGVLGRPRTERGVLGGVVECLRRLSGRL